MDAHNFWYWLLEGIRNLVGVLSGRLPLYAPIGMGTFLHNLLAAAATPILFYIGSIFNLCWLALVFGLIITSEIARGIMAAYRTVVKAVPLP